MTYTVSGANFNKDVAAQGTSINYKENKAVKSEGVAGSFAGVVISGSVTAANDNTYEGLLKEADDVKSQIMASASSAKISLKALMMKLSGADAVKLDEDGFNLTDATPDDMVNIIEKIKIELAMHSDDYVNYGTAVSKDKIESVTGSAATAASVESRMQGADIAVNDESVAEVKGTLEKSKELKPLSENTKNYMVANRIEPSIAGIYQAQAATSSSISADGVTIGKCADAISDADFEALRPGIEKIIASSGLEVNDNTLADARAFINAQIPVTKENLEYKAQLDAIDIEKIQADPDEMLNKILDDMKLGGKAENTLVTGSPIDDIRTALDTINRAEYSDVANVVSKGETFTIASLKLEMDARSFRIEYSAASVSTGNSEVRNQASDVQQAAASLVNDVDAFFTPNDNTVASAMAAYLQVANDAGKPIYCGADSMVNDGGFATVGIDYDVLGVQTGEMIERIVNGATVADTPVEQIAQYAKMINVATAKQLGIEIPQDKQEEFQLLGE